MLYSFDSLVGNYRKSLNIEAIKYVKNEFSAERYDLNC